MKFFFIFIRLWHPAVNASLKVYLVALISIQGRQNFLELSRPSQIRVASALSLIDKTYH